MELVLGIYKIEQLNKYIGYIDAAILMSKGLALVYEDLDLDLAIEACLKNKVKPIIAINKIFQPSDINAARIAINKYKDNPNIYFYASDIGICNIALENKIESRFIFNPETMITNYKDLEIYNGFGFDALAMSNEITLEDLIKAYDLTKASLFYLGFGHRLMFYSKRKLISLYSKKNNSSYLADNMYLRESTRNDFLPIIENENGTMIYRSYLISLIDNLDNLEFLKYLYLDPLYIDEASFYEAVKCFRAVIENEISSNAALEILDNLGLDIKDGFKYQDSVYQKEELKR